MYHLNHKPFNQAILICDVIHWLLGYFIIVMRAVEAGKKQQGFARSLQKRHAHARDCLATFVKE